MPSLHYCPFPKDEKSFSAQSLNPFVQRRIAELCGHFDFEKLTEQILEQSNFAIAAEFRFALEVCRLENAFDYVVRFEGQIIATLRPLSAAFKIRKHARPGVLSRFAYLQRKGQLIVLASPCVDAYVEFPDASIDSLAFALRSTAPGPMQFLLAEAGFLDSTEEPDVPSCFWEFHDLLFHRASRLGHSDGPVGATWRLAETCKPLAAVKEPMSDDRVPLDASLQPMDEPTFRDVLKNRRSRRQPGKQPITLSQLSKFLHDALAIQTRFRSGDDELLLRPYPSGGAIHELEFYIAARRCAGLAVGLYHYHPAEHALYRLPCAPAGFDKLVQLVENLWAPRYIPPDLLFILSARLPRVAWKYEKMAYRTILINAGAALQTMYLVATAMNLAPCAIGNGDPRQFAAVTGLSIFEETSVAEFALSATET